MENRQPVLDTGPAPVCPLFPHYVHILTLCLCRGISSISEIRGEIQMKTGYSFWAKNRQNSDVIDIQALLKRYWISTEHEFTVHSKLRLTTSPPISDREAQRPSPLESTTVIYIYDYLQILLSVSLQLSIPAS